MIFKNIDVLIVTRDIRLNQTFTNRYNSFNQTLNNNGYKSKIIGFSFPFKPNPNNNLKKNNNYLLDNHSSFMVRSLNPIQKLILLADRINLSFSRKKLLLALHIIFYKADQWIISKKELFNLDFKASIIISGSTNGLIQSASLLADKYKAKLILDYRDPWNFGYHLLETNGFIYRVKRLFTLRQEIKLLKQADHIITVSESLKSFFPQQFHNKISIIENGSNYEYDAIKHKINTSPDQFNIIYLGTIYNDQLIDETFFIALERFLKGKNLVKKQFKIYFLGSILSTRLTKLIQKYDLESFTIITERLNKDEIANYLENASIFLHLKYGNRSQIITSKNADYLMFKKPILLPVSDHGDLAESIQKYKAGYVCNSVDETMNALNIEYTKFLKKEKITLNNGDFSFLSRSEISKKLITVLKNIV